MLQSRLPVKRLQCKLDLCLFSDCIARSTFCNGLFCRIYSLRILFKQSVCFRIRYFTDKPCKLADTVPFTDQPNFI
jgi:hypothetical protein